MEAGASAAIFSFTVISVRTGSSFCASCASSATEAHDIIRILAFIPKSKGITSRPPDLRDPELARGKQ